MKADRTVALRSDGTHAGLGAGEPHSSSSGEQSRARTPDERGSGYVLFVDDDESNLVVWEAACSEQFDVLTASDAEQALALLGTHDVAVILADQRMPHVTGIELLERVRHEFPDVIRMLITAYTDLNAAIEAINRGHVRRYLNKPCALPELRAEIRDAMDLHGLRRRMAVAERRLLLTERVYALGVVAAGIGREIARPAGWIRESVLSARGDVQSATSRLDAESADVRGLRTRLTDVEAHLERALHGVERVIDIARSVESTCTGEDDGPVELTEVLRLSLKAVRGEIRHGTALELDIEPVAPVRCTSAKLGQVTLNLLVTAIEAVAKRPPGEREIGVRLFEKEGSVRLEVTDNGACVSEEALRHLFDPFQSTAGPRGSGLGLAISRAIVEEAGGALDVANRAGGGVLFRVVLPRCNP